jgi:apolipoprotein N-acyltransferase
VQLNLLTRLFAIILTGLLHPLCFPHFNLGWLAWAVLVPLHLIIEKAEPKDAFRYGWLAGVIAFTGTITWVITAMNQYGQVPFVVSALWLYKVAQLASWLAVAWGTFLVGLVGISPYPCL